MDKGIRTTCSPDLLAAQKLLEILRDRHKPQRYSYDLSVPRFKPGKSPRPGTNNSSPDELTDTPSTPESQVKLYPDIGLALLRQGHEAAGRVWLLLQYLDKTGRGWLDLQEVRQQLILKESRLRICGERQLRKLLSRGEGLFWQRNNDRLWLRSTTKVAAGLGVNRLTGHPVAIPINALLKGIGMVRAHFYASFHSGRNGQSAGSPPARPIARTSLQEISNVSRRTQRLYEKRTGVRSNNNFAIGKKATKELEQHQSWKSGQAVFRFIDYNGKMGGNGVTYIAWQLPNRYVGPHEQQPKGRQKRMNRELADLFTKGMTGNGKETVQSYQSTDMGNTRRFYEKGSLAAASYNRCPNQEIFWRSQYRQAGRYQLWHVMSARETT